MTKRINQILLLLQITLLGRTQLGVDDCIVTKDLRDGPALAVLVPHGVVCFQCVVGGEPAADATFTIDSSAVASSDGSTATAGVLVVYDSASIFPLDTSPHFVACMSGGVTVSTLVILEVFQPPEITGERTVDEGDTLALDCDASNSQPLPSVAWFSPQSLVLTNVRILIVENITRSEAGTYTCVATADSTGDMLINSTVVTVQYAPSVTTTYASTQYLPLGMMLVLMCDYQALPTPDTVMWSLNSSVIVDSDLITFDNTSTVLTRTTLTADDGGVYTCIATNTVGTGSQDIAVQVQFPPAIPTNLTVIARTSESLLLNWTNPQFTGFSGVAGYRLRVTSDTEPQMERMLDGLATTYNLTELRPLQQYTVSVYVRNQAGLEGVPATTTAHTASLRLPEVGMLLIQVISSTELYVQWTTPAFDASTTAEPDSYIVTYYNNEKGERMAMTTTLNITLLSLEKGSEYTVTVVGVNEAGPGDPQIAAPVQTAVDAPTAPQHFRATSTTPFTLMLTWTPPSDDGGRPLQLYRLQVSGGINTSPVTSELKVDILSILLSNLTQNTTYQLLLVAVNSVGLESEASYDQVTSQAVGPPQIPHMPSIIAISDHSADVVWTEPGGYPLLYIIQYKMASLSWDDSTESLEVTSTFYTLTCLQPITDYTIRIASQNINDVSDFSKDTLFGTFGDIIINGPSNEAGPHPAGDPLSLHCTVGTTANSPTPLYTWSRNGGSLPTHVRIDNVTGTLTLTDPSLADSGVYVCSTAGIRSSISVSIDAEPHSNTSANWILAVSVVLAILLVSGVVICILICCCICRTHYNKYDFEGVNRKMELELKTS